MSTAPEVISRYGAAAAAGDLDALIGCFTAGAHVRDHGQDHHGAAQIRAWREGLASRFTYTTQISGPTRPARPARRSTSPPASRGAFPGGVVDLDQALHPGRRADRRPRHLSR
jgi:hypothetical protein